MLGDVKCSSEDCPTPAVEALRIAGMPGHVHDCAAHAHDLREFCDVTASAALVAGACPWPCTPTPLYASQPRPL